MVAVGWLANTTVFSAIVCPCVLELVPYYARARLGTVAHNYLWYHLKRGVSVGRVFSVTSCKSSSCGALGR